MSSVPHSIVARITAAQRAMSPITKHLMVRLTPSRAAANPEYMASSRTTATPAIDQATARPTKVAAVTMSAVAKVSRLAPAKNLVARKSPLRYRPAKAWTIALTPMTRIRSRAPSRSA